MIHAWDHSSEVGNYGLIKKLYRNDINILNITIQRAPTPPRPKSDSGFESGFPDKSGSGCLPDRSQNVLDSFSRPVSNFAKYRKNRPVTACETLINLPKSPNTPQMVREMEKWSVIRIRNRITTSRGSPLAHAYHVWLTSVTTIVSYPAHRNDRTTDGTTEWQIDQSHYCSSFAAGIMT